MTWAKNYTSARIGQDAADGKRAKKIDKACAKCGVAIPSRKTYCGPCYDVRLQETISRNRKTA